MQEIEYQKKKKRKKQTKTKQKNKTKNIKTKRTKLIYCFINSLLITGFLLFKDFCENVYDKPVPQLKFYEEVSYYPGLPTMHFFSFIFFVCVEMRQSSAT